MSGSTFDAGTVYAEARLDRDTFQKDLAQLRKDMAAFEKEQFRVRVGADQRPLDAGIKDARSKMVGLSRETATPKVGADHRTFMSRMLDVRRTLKQVHEIVSTPLILVDIARSMIRVKQIRYELRNLARQYVIDVIIYPRFYRDLMKISDAMLSIKNVARATLPPLVPMLTAVAGAALVVSGSLVGAGGALGVFALGAIPVLAKVVTKSKEIEEAQKKVTEAITAPQRATALRELDALLQGLSEQERQAVLNVNEIKFAWRGFQTAIQPAVFSMLGNSVSLISKLLPPLVPVVNAVADVMNRWIDAMERGVDSGGFKKFTDWLAGPGTASLDAWGRAIGNFVTGFVNMLMAANPAIAEFNGGLVSMSERFLAWSKTLETNQQFQEFLRFTMQVMPDVLTILGQLTQILWEVHLVFAPITEAVLGFVAGFMKAHPELTKFLVVGYLVSQFLIGATMLVAGFILKILVLAAIFGRVGQVMAIGSTAGKLWGALMKGEFAKVGAHAAKLVKQLFKLTAVGRIIGVITKATALWTAAQWLLNVALTANPIGIVIVAIAALVAGLILAWNYSETFRAYVLEMWRELGVAATWAWENAIKPVLDALVTAWDAVVAAVTAAVDWIVGAWDSLVAAATAAVDWIVGAWDSFLSFMSSLPGKIGTFLSELPGTIAYWIGYAVGFLVGLPARIWAALSSLGTWLAEIATTAWNSFTTAIVNAWNATYAWFVALPERIVSALTSLGTWLAETATTAWNGFTEGIVAAWNATYKWFATLPERIQAALSSLGPWLIETAATAWAGFTEGLASAWTATIDWLSQVPGWIMEFFAAAPQWLWDAGVAIWDGLIGGLGSAWNAVISFLSGLVESFLSGFRDGLGIASPSTVFFQFGIDIFMGLLNGLISMGTAVLTWIGDWVLQLVEWFMSGLDQVVTFWTDLWNSLPALAQAAWDLVVAGLTAAWGFIQEGFSTGVQFIVDLWNNFWEGLRIVATTIFDAISNGILTILTWIGSLFGTTQEQIRAGWDAFWNGVQSIASTIWNAIKVLIDTVWNAIKQAFAAAMALLRGDWQGFWDTLSNLANSLFNKAKAAIDAVWNGIKAAFNAAIAFLKGLWSDFWNGLKSVASSVGDAIKAAIDRVLSGIKNTFNDVVNGIKAAWERLKAIVSAPIKAAGFSGGGVVPGAALGGVIPEYARGGVLPGYSPGRDIMTANSPIGPVGLSGGEAIMRPEWTRAVGRGWIDEANRLARVGGVDAVRRFMSSQDLGGGAEALARLWSKLMNQTTAGPKIAMRDGGTVRPSSGDSASRLIDTGKVHRPDGENSGLAGLARSIAGQVRDQAPLIGSITVPTSEMVSARDVADEVIFKLRSVRRGGVHSGRSR